MKKPITPILLIILLVNFDRTDLIAQQTVQVNSKEFIAYSLYNFSKLIDWPNSASATVFKIAVVGDKNVYDALVELSTNKKVWNAVYQINYYKNTDEMGKDHQIIYLSNLHSDKVKLLSQNPECKNILFVTEREKMAKYGSAISFTVTDKGTMGFEIAKANAAKNNLTVRAQLERMAVQVL